MTITTITQAQVTHSSSRQNPLSNNERKLSSFATVAFRRHHMQVVLLNERIAKLSADGSHNADRASNPISCRMNSQPLISEARNEIGDQLPRADSAGSFAIPSTKKTVAAIAIQNAYRCHLAKLKTAVAKSNTLTLTLFEQAKEYLKSPSNYQNLPRASFGITPVYLPKELPVVLKQSGSLKNQQRYVKMQQARAICKKNNYQRLVIPKARAYGQWIIEDRLPITEPSFKEQIGLYIEHRDQFTDAVKEFIQFLCQSTLTDIAGRYDNVPLYLETGHGTIGLIDLERFLPNTPNTTLLYDGCCSVISLFPLHFDDILSIAKECNPDIESRRKELEIVRDQALCHFTVIYHNHLRFLKSKGIGLNNPLAITTISQSKKEDLDVTAPSPKGEGF